MVRIGTWNTEWAKPGTARGDRVKPLLADSDCDILCVTEGYKDILPSRGYAIDGGINTDYPVVEGRRKVLLWSKQPWSNVDAIGSDELPSGRFVAGTTQSSAGPLTVVGVCIPWHMANVIGGRNDSKPWQEHAKWLEAFRELRYRRSAERTVVLGDFNQRIPRSWTPKRIYKLLLRAFDGLRFATKGELNGAPHAAIDHIAHTRDMVTIGDFGIWPTRNDDDKPLSDHFGMWGNFDRSSTTSART